MGDERVIVLFDETRSVFNHLDSSYIDLKDILKENGFECKKLTKGPISEDILKGDILVITCPNNALLSEKEINSILKFVREGGGLFVLNEYFGDKEWKHNLSDLCKNFGITFNDDSVIDDMHNYGDNKILKISRECLMEHPITLGMESFAYINGCSLSVLGEALVIIKTDGDAKPPDAPLLAVNIYGDGRVIVTGDSSIFVSSWLGFEPSNAILAVNCFRWLRGDF